MGHIKVLKPGLCTTIQDKGRKGYQQYGMPTAGAMDEFSLRVANLLVGNNEFEACIEVTMLGPEILFEGHAVIAITGGNLSPKVNNKPVPMWHSLKIYKGDILSFGGMQSGCRSYIAFAGGLDIEEVMGSKSTYLRGGVGGFQGRTLKIGDEISFKDARVSQNVPERAVPQWEIPVYNNDYIIRVISGPQDDYFTQEALQMFFNSQYAITNEADRMGYRLSGPKLQHSKGADIISDGVGLGSIQVPGHGMPIIMMADRQTTGGYPKIATVISSDIPALAQVKPGDKIRFRSVTIEEAHRILFDYEERIKRIKKHISETKIQPSKERKFKMKVNGKEYELTIQEIY